MKQSHLAQPCSTCGGNGVVPRERRRLPNGEMDTFDTLDWPHVTCDVCAGSGQVLVDPATVNTSETVPG